MTFIHEVEEFNSKITGKHVCFQAEISTKEESYFSHATNLGHGEFIDHEAVYLATDEVVEVTEAQQYNEDTEEFLPLPQAEAVEIAQEWFDTYGTTLEVPIED
jgi:hypothetical protein